MKKLMIPAAVALLAMSGLAFAQAHFYGTRVSLTNSSAAKINYALKVTQGKLGHTYSSNGSKTTLTPGSSVAFWVNYVSHKNTHDASNITLTIPAPGINQTPVTCTYQITGFGPAQFGPAGSNINYTGNDGISCAKLLQNLQMNPMGSGDSLFSANIQMK